MAKIYHKFAEYVTPVLKSSKFVEEGVLTPEEFVAAGDQLVFKSPVWQWASGDPSKQKSYLPADKQFLLCRGARCSRRIADIDSEGKAEKSIDVGEDSTGGEWTAAGDDDNEEVMDFMEAQETKKAADISALIKEGHISGARQSNDEEDEDEDDDDGEVMDLLDFETQGLSLDDAAVIQPSGEPDASSNPEDGKIVRVEDDDDEDAPRTYDVSILYDKRYRTPRVYLLGYDAGGAPLTGEQMFEDIMPDYREKTVTMEQHPHLAGGEVHGSIHPCRHAKVMKSLTQRMREGGIDVRPEHAMFVFLKFIASVIPTIEYDQTFSLSAAHTNSGGAGGGSG